MYYIDPHIHMISRVTDDYQRMAQCGCVAISEPAFWAGFDRGSAEGFRDYFRHLTEYEPKRAAQFGIRHYSWLCINAKEAENVSLSREVIAMIPEFLNKPGVLGIGEIGLNKNTKNEATIFQEHVDLAMKTNELILIHTPTRGQVQGARMIVTCSKRQRIDPVACWSIMSRSTRPPRSTTVLVRHDALSDHEVHAGAGWTSSSGRHGPIMPNSAGDWGKSNPLAVPELIQEMKRRGHSEAAIRKVVYDNPLAFFRQSNRWQEWPAEAAKEEKARAKPVKAAK